MVSEAALSVWIIVITKSLQVEKNFALCVWLGLYEAYGHFINNLE